MTSFWKSKFATTTKYLNNTAGDPSTPGMQHGPQVSQIQFDVSLIGYLYPRSSGFQCMIGNIEFSKEKGAMAHIRGIQLREEEVFIKPTIFTHRYQGVKIPWE